MIKTYRYKVKNNIGLLNKQARSVNFVWNYCNDIQKKAIQLGRKYPTYLDFCMLLNSSSKEIGLNSNDLRQVSKTYVNSREGSKRKTLRYRSNKKSLGWIPVSSYSLKIKNNKIWYFKKGIEIFRSRVLPKQFKILDGSNFSQDTKGNWYINLVLEIPDPENKEKTNKKIGIDLGLKDFLTTSDGFKIEAKQFYRKTEEKLAKAQRANKKKQVRNIYTKIKNQRKDFLHKLSTQLVESYDNIFVGNVNSSSLSKTRIAKSVNDAGWSAFKTMLKYKCDYAGVGYKEVDEKYTTVTCSSCSSRTGPTGLGELRIRQWTCSNCGTEHDRDVNAAKNILARSGYGTPVEGALVKI